MERGEIRAPSEFVPPLLSLVVPVWNLNDGGILSLSVRQEVEALGANLQLIIVDDQSDEARFSSLIRAYGHCPNAIIVRTASNCGPGAARNIGLDLVTSPWVAFADADDNMHVDAYFGLAQRGKLSHLDVVAGTYRVLRSHGTRADTNEVEDHPGTTLIKTISRRAAVWRFAFRTDLLRRHAIRFPEIRYAEDLLFMLQVALLKPAYSGFGDLNVTTYFPPSPYSKPDCRSYQVALEQLARTYESSEDPDIRRLIATWRLRIVTYTLLSNRMAGKYLVRALEHLWPHSGSEVFDLAIAMRRMAFDFANSPPVSIYTHPIHFKMTRKRRSQL